MIANAHIGVVLLNLGTAETPSELPRYIRRLLSDPDVVALPWPLRQLVGIIAAWRRAGPVAERYRAIGGRSPLHEETRRQVQALSAVLGQGWIVRHAFRHSEPFADAVLAGLRALGVSRVVALPGYPQYAGATTGSGLKDVARAAKRHDVELAELRSYPDAEGYVESLAAGTAERLEPGDYVLYSAHGLPQRAVDAGDPYVGEIHRSLRAAAARLPPGTPWSLAFQSRVGRMKWTGPALPDELVRLGQQDVRSVLIVPLSFACENFETVYELDIQHAEIARAAGIRRYRRVPAPGTHPAFVRALADLCRNAAREAGWEPFVGATGRERR